MKKRISLYLLGLICTTLIFVLKVNDNETKERKVDNSSRSNRVTRIAEKKSESESKLNQSQDKKEIPEIKIVKKNTVLEKFSFHESKILKGQVDIAALENILSNKENIKRVSKVMLRIPEEGYSTEDYVEREKSIAFFVRGFELDPKNEFLAKESKRIILNLLKEKHSRNIQKSINGDVLDLMSSLNKANPGLMKEIVSDNSKAKRYFEYMRALEETI